MKTTLYSLLYVTLVGITQLGFAIGQLSAAEQQQLAQASQNSFDNYRQQCLQQARGEGLTADVANDLCNCTIKKFRERYSLQQFRDLVQKSKTNRTAQQTLTQVGEACFDQVLYE